MGVIQIPPALWDKIPYELQTKMIDLYALIEAYTTQYVPSNIVPVFVLLVILSVVYTVLEFLYIHFLQGTPKNLSKKYGSWALVTGATDGIGFAMSKEFAKKGMNVCIVGRSQEKIDKCVAFLRVGPGKNALHCSILEGERVKTQKLVVRTARNAALVALHTIRTAETRRFVVSPFLIEQCIAFLRVFTAKTRYIRRFSQSFHSFLLKSN